MLGRSVSWQMLWRSDFVCWSSKNCPSLCNNHMIRTTDIVAAVVMLVGISTPTRAQVQEMLTKLNQLIDALQH